jgi:hypothetical protein
MCKLSFSLRFARQWRLMPVTPANEEAEIRRIRFTVSPGKQFERPYLEESFKK